MHHLCPIPNPEAIVFPVSSLEITHVFSPLTHTHRWASFALQLSEKCVFPSRLPRRLVFVLMYLTF